MSDNDSDSNTDSSTGGPRRPRPTVYSRIAVVAVVAGALVVAFAIFSAVHHGGGHPANARAATIGSATRPAITLSAPPTAASSAPTIASESMSPAAVTAPASTTAPASAAAAPPTAAAPATPKQVTYTVKRGDNLTKIAAWFDQHGYQPVYAWNRTVIGQDPNLILPGQVLIVAVQ